MSTLIVLRHGQALHNIQERYNSNPDNPGYFLSPLTEKGKDQVRATGNLLLAQGFSKDTIGHVYVSPLPRTIETATVLQEMGVIKDFVIDKRLIEVDMGDREGHYYREYTGDLWDHSQAHAYHGETDLEVRKRVEELLQEIEAQCPDQTVLFVTHGTPALELIGLSAHKKIRLNPAEFKIISH